MVMVVVLMGYADLHKRIVMSNEQLAPQARGAAGSAARGRSGGAEETKAFFQALNQRQVPETTRASVLVDTSSLS